MKVSCHCSCRPRAPRGIALIFVLGAVALLMVLVLTLLSLSRTEMRSATAFSQIAGVRSLSELPVNLVMAQIREATSGLGMTKTWASQPGMIRVFGNTDSGNGRAKLDKAWKLYSSDTMVSAAYDAAAEVNAMTGWDKTPTIYTDINEPVAQPQPDGTVKRVYPIMDVAVVDANGDGRVDAPSGGQTKSSVVDGAAITGPLPGESATHPLPMPVKWIYVTQDGRYALPTGESGGEASFDAAVVNASNPVVGRIAFWTDDESCKLNVNTASEPTPWDTPRAVCIQDMNYGKFQPANKEYQRYPGHPFMTALSPVFFPGKTTATLTVADRQAIYDFVPRVQSGGSTAGTVIATSATAVTPDQDRLFANIDECYYSAALSGGTRVKTTAISNVDFLNKRRFFLTANSRAPELNLYGRPRISLWPEGPVSKQTAYDKLAAFCSSTQNGSYPSYFQRSDSLSPINDWINIKRNRDVYTYLQAITALAVPGFGGDFKTKLGADRDQVLTEIFDYIRCVNLRDNSIGATQFTTNGQVAPIRIDSNNTKGFGRFQTISQFGIHFICGQDGPNGLSTVDTTVAALPAGQRNIEASLLFEPFSPSLGYHELSESLSYQVTLKTPMSVNGTDLQFPTGTVTKPSSNSFGGIWHGRTWGGAQGIRGLIKSFGLGTYPLVSKRIQVAASGAKPTMAFSGGTLEVKVYSGTTPSAANLVQTFTINYPGGTFPVPQLVSTGTQTFRGAKVTAPDYWWSFAQRYSAANSCPHAPGSEYADPTRRWGANPGTGWKDGGVFRAEDVVRTIVPMHGDIRLIAAQTIPTAVSFIQGAYYGDTTRMIDHLFQEPQGPHMLYGFGNEPGLTSAVGDQLTPAKYHYARTPEITPGAGKKYNKWNDFDNGPAHLIDGAYINKPDEGNIAAGGKGTLDNSDYPYFSWDYVAPTFNLFSPNRLVPSAGMLGSLPTGVKRNQPWQTLLFRPDATNTHPGAVAPKDHLLMDLFWMPVIEPYAVSEPYSTAGKINLNYAIAPFSYIRRATGLYGAMKSEEPLAIPTALSTVYKLWDHETNDWPSYPDNVKDSDPAVRTLWKSLYTGTTPYDKLRKPINMDETLKQFDARFAAGDIFRTASEICEMHLVRDDGESLTEYTKDEIWPKNLVTGENTRERPYTNLYARFTTRSNTYQVHYRVQLLQKARSTSASKWNETKDRVTAEQRGSVLLERYLDPNDPDLPDYVAKPDTAGALDDYYRFRVIGKKLFTP